MINEAHEWNQGATVILKTKKDINRPNLLLWLPVVDTGFSWGGAPTSKLGLFCKFFAENCMKMKEVGFLGGVPGTALGSANGYHSNGYLLSVWVK